MKNRDELIGSVVELAVPSEHGGGYVLGQVVAQCRGVGMHIMHRLMVFEGLSNDPIDDYQPRLEDSDVLFVVGFAVAAHLKRGLARVLGEGCERPVVRELPPSEIWNIALVGAAVRHGWRTGDDDDVLFE